MVAVFAVFERVPRKRVISLRRTRVATVRRARPKGRAEAVFAVDVIPTRVNQRAVVVDGRAPLARFEVTDRVNIGTVRFHRVHHRRRNAERRAFAETTNETAAPLRAENEPPGRKLADVEIVVSAVG